MSYMTDGLYCGGDWNDADEIENNNPEKAFFDIVHHLAVTCHESDENVRAFLLAPIGRRS